MSWLDFSNHFLSNQRLYVWSWINRTFSRMVFWRGIWLWLLWPFPFLFLFSAGQESRWHKGFWLAIKGRGPLQVMVSFFFLFACDNSNIVRSEGLSVYFFCFLLLFDQEFSFFFLSPNLWLEIFFFCFLSILDRELSFFCFLLRARMGILTLGQGLWWFEVLAQGL